MPSANYYMNFTCADPLHMANIYSVRTTIFSATILKRELQNLQRHFFTSTTTVHYPRGSSHIVLLRYQNSKPIFLSEVRWAVNVARRMPELHVKRSQCCKICHTASHSQPLKFQSLLHSLQGKQEMQSLVSVHAGRSLNNFVTCCHSCHDLFSCIPRQALFVQISYGIQFHI